MYTLLKENAQHIYGAPQNIEHEGDINYVYTFL